MKRNSTTLFLVSPGATTPIPWVNDAPDFSAFTEPTLSVLQKAWNDFTLSRETLEIIPDPVAVVEIPVPDWDGFNAYILSDVVFNTAFATVLGIAPALPSAVMSAYSIVATNGATAFSATINPFCTLGGVSVEQRGAWADTAASFNLPADFVLALRGN